MEFSNLTPKDIPLGCHPNGIFNIKLTFFLGRACQINLYITSATRNLEIQRQMMELMEKGYIRKSTSLCVVPALIVPKKDDS